MITAVTSLRRLLRLPAVLMVLVAATAATFAQSQDWVLKTIIEKTRKREALLDNFDWRLKRTSGDASRPEGVITDETRYVKSGERWLYECKSWDSASPQKIQTSLLACDGAVMRTLYDHGLSGGKHGSMERAGGSLQAFGVELGLKVPSLTTKLSDLLEGKRDDLGHGSYNPNVSLEMLPPEERTVAGRICYTVSFIEKDEHSGELYRVTRVSFAPDLEFACVGVEEEAYESGTIRSTLSYNLSDFREAKDGLFLPFKWAITRFDKGVQSRASETEVVSFESRTSFDDSLFTFSFPEGVLVQDNLIGDTYNVGEAVPGEEALIETLAELRPVDEPEGTSGAEEGAAEAVAAATDAPSTGQEAATEPQGDGSLHIDSGRGQGFVPVGLVLVVLVILAAAFGLRAALRRRGKSA